MNCHLCEVIHGCDVHGNSSNKVKMLEQMTTSKIGNEDWSRYRPRIKRSTVLKQNKCIKAK